jgi:predicted dehydrogenase
MRDVRVGVVGAGWVVQNRHLPGLAAAPGARVTEIWSRERARADHVAVEFSIPTVVDDWRSIVASPSVDAVVVATPPILHAPVSIAALDAGKHVLCQGRMARNLSEAHAMLEAAARSERVAALYPPRPGLKGDRVVRRLLASGALGEVREVRVTGMDSAAPTEGYRWQVDPDVIGVNALTLGMWAEVLQRWLGPVASVSATTAGGGEEGTAVPDSIAIVGRLASGATLSAHFSSAGAFGPGSSIEIFGTRGAIAYKLFGDELRAATEGDSELAVMEVAPGEERQQTTDREFIEAIQTGSPISPTFEDGVRYMEFCEAVAVSAAEGRAVILPLEAPAMAAWGRRLG